MKKIWGYVPVNGVTSLDIIDQTEVFAGLFNLDDIHETSWESAKNRLEVKFSKFFNN